MNIPSQIFANQSSRFDALFQNDSLGILLINKKGDIVSANNFLLSQFGYKDVDELVGKKVEMLIPNRFHKHHHHYRDGYFDNPEQRAMGAGRDLFAIRKSGEEFPVEISLSSYKGEDENDYLGIAFVSDISKRKEIEQEIIQQKQQSEALFQNASLGILVIDKSGHIVSANKFLLSQFEYANADELIGQKVEMLIPQRFHKHHEHYREGYVANPEIRPMGEGRDLFGIKKNGKEFPVEISLSSFNNDGGKFGIAFISDITKRKEIEDAILRQQQKFSALIQNSADGILITNREGNVFFASPSVEKIFGHTLKEFMKLRPRDLIHPDDQEMAAKKREWLDKNPGKPITYLIRLSNKAGKWMWHEATATNLYDDPSINGLLTNIRDVSERVVLEKHREDFVSIATHELKTPVTSIKAYAQFLRSRFEKDGDIASASLVGKMDVQLNRLIGLIEDLLDATKIEGGKLVLHEYFYDFNELVDEIVSDMQRTTAQHKIIVKLGDTAKVYGDRNRIGQVLTNLISNAIKYSPGKDEISVTSELKENSVQLSVEDHGVGIAEKFRSKIFDRFYRVSGPYTNTFPGLGLGLYISSELVKRHHGRIWVQSTEGEGSTFCISLPFDYRTLKK
jgi:PAS domain S-box-containing protein